MYEIEMHEASEEFARCWGAAGMHLEKMWEGEQLMWLKANLYPPFLEHLSFRIGNQLFFIRIEDVQGVLKVPGSRVGLAHIAEECKGHACLMEMRRTVSGWEPVNPGWGLVDLNTGRVLDPPDLVTDELIEMTDWELQDFGVQIVRTHIENEMGYELMSFQTNPEAVPSLWFVGDDGPEWVIVRPVRYPEVRAEMPANLGEIAKECARLSSKGHFASVAFAAADVELDPENPEPLWRGHAAEVEFEGLEAISGETLY